METLYYHARIILADDIISDGMVLVEDTKIKKVYPAYEELDVEQRMDMQGMILVPGFLDTHIHGALGYDFNVMQVGNVQKVADYLMQEGVTGFFASLVCEHHEDMLRILGNYEACTCPNLLGIHMEGPYLNKQNKAVMKEDCLRNPNLEEFKEYLATSTKIRSMSIAPELEGAKELIQYGTARGIVMNVGHSSASAQEVVDAQSWGCKGVTHLYNAMTQQEHRNPGVVTGAILSSLSCELIVDGFHVHPQIITSTCKAIDKSRLLLISDANPCMGLRDGSYTFSGKQINIQDGQATVLETGRIAGSTITIQKAIQNMKRYSGLTYPEVIRMATYQPSILYHLSTGRIEEGCDADLLFLDDSYDIQAQVCRGKIMTEMKRGSKV